MEVGLVDQIQIQLVLLFREQAFRGLFSDQILRVVPLALVRVLRMQLHSLLPIVHLAQPLLGSLLVDFAT